MLEALVGQKSAFARTPKYRVETKKDKINAIKYRRRLGWVPWVELLIGTYFALTVYYAIANENYITVPFLVLFVLGYWYTGLMSLASRPLLGLVAGRGGSHQALSCGRLADLSQVRSGTSGTLRSAFGWSLFGKIREHHPARL